MQYHPLLCRIVPTGSDRRNLQFNKLMPGSEYNVHKKRICSSVVRCCRSLVFLLYIDYIKNVPTTKDTPTMTERSSCARATLPLAISSHTLVRGVTRSKIT